jgi:hypoxanthine phosphoribosyltransferase
MSSFEKVVKADAAATTPGMNNVRRAEPLFISDDATISLDHFFVPAHYHDTLECLLIPHGTVVSRVEKLARDIAHDFAGQTIVLLCVLKGGTAFFNDLCQALSKIHEYEGKNHTPYVFDFVRVKSYSGTSSTGEVSISGCDVSKLKGKHVIFVEDIVDTGLTMTKVFEYMKERVEPASINVATICEKRTHLSCGFQARYVGFSIPDKFVVGYGMDYNEIYRDLHHIGVINAAGIEKFKNV